MKRTIRVYGSFFAVILLILTLNGSAVEYTVHKSQTEHEENCSILSSILPTTNFPNKLWDLINIIISILVGGTIGVAFSKLYFSRTVYVDDDATENWYDFHHVRTIQEGIDHALLSFANNVRVYDGVYQGQIVMKSSPFMPGNMGLRVIGNASSSTIIDAKDCDYGITLTGISGWSRIIGVTIKNANGPGINIGNSQWNFIYENTLINNTIGIKNEGGNYCPIWKNNFINNDINAYDSGNTEWSFSWESYYGDEEAQKTGNYWSDYTGVDENEDGIGDTVYHITGGNSIDSNPLIQPWEE